MLLTKVFPENRSKIELDRDFLNWVKEYEKVNNCIVHVMSKEFIRSENYTSIKVYTLLIKYTTSDKK
jgi:hypothetical protein